MDTDTLMQGAKQRILNEPRDGADNIAIAQAYALLAIANELKRLNDRADDEISRQELFDSTRIYGTGE